MPSSSTMPLSPEPPFLCANEAVIAGLLDAESHHMPEKDYLRHCRDSSVDVTTCLAAFAPGLFAVKEPFLIYGIQSPPKKLNLPHHYVLQCRRICKIPFLSLRNRENISHWRCSYIF
ncbi:hypothetical protein AAZX31_13G182300 [Glycine max]